MSEPAARPPERCRYCQRTVASTAHDVVVFDDRRIAHLACYVAAEGERQAAAAAASAAPAPNGEARHDGG
jgi:hypothetical protein